MSNIIIFFVAAAVIFITVESAKLPEVKLHQAKLVEDSHELSDLFDLTPNLRWEFDYDEYMRCCKKCNKVPGAYGKAICYGACGAYNSG